MTLRAATRLAFAAAFLNAGLAPASAAAPKHVILIIMENHGTDTLFGNKQDASFINELIAEPGVRYVTQYYGVTHPSLPIYLALVAGDDRGIHYDCKGGRRRQMQASADEPATAGHLLTEEQEQRAAETAHLSRQDSDRSTRRGQALLENLNARNPGRPKDRGIRAVRR
jgi:phosphatidylinositol-3-phosphatase